jgi:SAM-dependent methyltransferase
MEAFLAAHPHRPRLAYFPNGVDTERFAPAVPTRPRTWRQVLYVGRLEPEKNLARLIDALGSIPAPPVRLVVVGDGSLRGDLEARAHRAGVTVEWIGVLPHGDLPRHFTEADCFVLPSLTEGHPKALIEAMACGLPCAASARGGIPSILEDGVTGLLFDPEDPADIARAINRLLTDEPLARGLAERARATASAFYDAHALLKDEAAFVLSLGREAEPAALFEDYAEAVPMDGVLPEFVARRLRELAGPLPRSVLDLGAGDGRYLGFLAALFPSGPTLVGCEISLRRARRIKALGFRVVVAQAEALPFRSGIFDLVMLLEVIEHTRSPERTLDETRRVLGRAGRLVLTTPNYPVKRLFDLRAAVRQRSLARLRDDPTHISPLSAGRLERLLRARFESVHVEGTAVPGEGHVRWLGRLRHSRTGRRLSNKLFALCTKPSAGASGGRGGGVGEGA